MQIFLWLSFDVICYCYVFVSVFLLVVLLNWCWCGLDVLMLVVVWIVVWTQSLCNVQIANRNLQHLNWQFHPNCSCNSFPEPRSLNASHSRLRAPTDLSCQVLLNEQLSHCGKNDSTRLIRAGCRNQNLSYFKWRSGSFAIIVPTILLFLFGKVVPKIQGKGCFFLTKSVLMFSKCIWRLICLVSLMFIWL